MSSHIPCFIGSMIGGALSAVAGFYFGYKRGAQDGIRRAMRWMQ